MIKNLTKYGIISFIGFILIYQLIPFGDYCTGLLNFLNSLALLGILIITLFILTVRNLIRIKKQSGRFDFIPLIIALFFGTIWYVMLDVPDKKFWTEKSLIGFVQIEGSVKSGTLELFKNGSFGASYHHADFSCTYQGDYEIIDNLLVLNRSDLSELTEKVFTTEYLINRKDSILTPMKNGFIGIRISKLIE